MATAKWPLTLHKNSFMKRIISPNNLRSCVKNLSVSSFGKIFIIISDSLTDILIGLLAKAIIGVFNIIAIKHWHKQKLNYNKKEAERINALPLIALRLKRIQGTFFNTPRLPF